ncbi:S41 family peptidase [Niabella insulamsoli]|uniref:S41 family peptidase n=1 Tax=Niabella insulamsoli TaxID=3144874 RepID=UPI0031FDFC57
MNKIFTLLLISVSLFSTSCDPDDEDIVENEPVVSQFVYDGMSTYYLWADGMKSKTPTQANENAPEDYFYSLLNPLDTENEWSWITDDVDALLADFSGTPKDFGWSLALYRVTGTNDVEAYVKYVFPNTPAANAGVKRGEIIFQIGGGPLTTSNYTQLFGGNTISVGVGNLQTSSSRTVTLTPVTIQTNPVLIDTVYRDRPEFAGKKIGYLFYSDFIAPYNAQLYNSFLDFKAQGVTDLVIDLRYNHGGGIEAANYLASLIAPRTHVESNKPFVKLHYNSFLNSLFSEGSRTDSLGVVGGITPLGANLNLNKVYIIATDDSYSAAELLTFCLRPYMQVVHIGSNTGGKFTASITIHAYDDQNDKAATVYDEGELSSQQKSKLDNWAMQPIVAKYGDGVGGDFENPGYLVPDVPVTSIENQPDLWKPLGDKDDYLLAEAISLITGLPAPAASQTKTVPRSVNGLQKIFSPMDAILKESVQLDQPQKRLNPRRVNR